MLILLLTKKILILCQALLKHKSWIVPVQGGHTHSFCPLYTNKYKYKHIDVCKAHYVMNWKLSNSFFPFYFISDGETERVCVFVWERDRVREWKYDSERERQRKSDYKRGLSFNSQKLSSFFSNVFRSSFPLTYIFRKKEVLVADGSTENWFCPSTAKGFSNSLSLSLSLSNLHIYVFAVL